MSVVDDTTSIEYRNSQEFPLYRAGTDGSIWSQAHQKLRHPDRRTWKRLRPRPIKGGYFLIALYRDNERFDRLVQRFILETFVGPCPPGMEACHLDHNPANNAVSNLMWGTHDTNMGQMKQAGRQSRGEGHSKAILAEVDVLDVRRLYADGETAKNLAARYGVSIQGIHGIVSGQNWRHLGGSSDKQEYRTVATKHVRDAGRAVNSVLKADDVRRIRELIRAKVKPKEIALQFGVSRSIIWAIKRGDTWADIA